MEEPKRGTLLLCFVAFVLLAFGWNISGAAEEKMSYEEYEAKLAEYAQRESAARAAIAEIQKDIDSLAAEIEETERKIAALQKEIYDLTQSDEAGVKAFDGELDRVKSHIQGLRALPPEELYKRRDEVTDVEGRFAQLKANPICFLPEVAEKVAGIEGMLAGLKASVPKIAPPDYYTVVRGDCLWTISAKEEIYGDPYGWPWIYTTNKDKIKNPDLIYPDWVLTIPRGVAPGHHLVVRGEWLAKIAGYSYIYNDPSKWTKIYEANRDEIKDPNLIFPYHVLEIPE